MQFPAETDSLGEKCFEKPSEVNEGVKVKKGTALYHLRKNTIRSFPCNLLHIFHSRTYTFNIHFFLKGKTSQDSYSREMLEQNVILKDYALCRSNSSRFNYLVSCTLRKGCVRTLWIRAPYWEREGGSSPAVTKSVS
jgi:hypothetical protein